MCRKVIEISAQMWYNDCMVRFNERMPRERARGMNAVVLAFVGDAVWSLYVREGLVFSADYKTGMLQKLASARVSAKGQAALAEGMLEKLTEEEREIFLYVYLFKKPTKARARPSPNTIFPPGSKRSSGSCISSGTMRVSTNCLRGEML